MSSNMASQSIQDTAIERMLVCNGYLQFYEENLYNFIKYCENICENMNKTLKKVWNMWDWMLIPFTVPFFAA